MVLLPDGMVLAISQARDAVRTHPNHEMPTGQRYWILGLMGWSTGTHETGLGPGHRRRARLGIAACRKALGAWDDAMPGDDRSHRCLQMAEDALTKRIDLGAANEFGLSCWAECIERFDPPPTDPTVSGGLWLGLAAAKAVWVAVRDGQFDPVTCERLREVDSFDIDVEDEDPSFLASCAYARGPSWVEGFDDQRRLEFWLWWLDEAVPAAWASEPDRN